LGHKLGASVNDISETIYSYSLSVRPHAAKGFFIQCMGPVLINETTFIS